MLGKTRLPFCRILHRETIERSAKSMILLGILIGVSPCLPLLGALTTIAGWAKGPFVGAFWGLSFGLGTILSPLIILALVAGGLGKLLSLKPILHQVASRICGTIQMSPAPFTLVCIYLLKSKRKSLVTYQKGAG